MLGTKHILFPIDFSERCRSVLPFVKSMAQRFGAKVTLMHVLQIPTGFYTGLDAAYPIALDLDSMRSDAEENLAAFFDVANPPLRGGIQITTDVGDPARLIVDYASANDVDMIMLPTHGYGGFRGLLLGSTAAKILHDAKCAVWTAAHSEDPHLLEHEQCRNILCAVELNGEGLPLLQRSLELAASFGATLRLVHAVPGAEPSPVIVPDHDYQHFLLQTARDSAARLQHKAGTNLELCIAAGAVSKVVRAAALQHHADLVIIGRGKLHETFGRLRTHAYSIIRDSPCPILSF
jgi:nucleotide-binding universal stress UspA family protein